MIMIKNMYVKLLYSVFGGNEIIFRNKHYEFKVMLRHDKWKWVKNVKIQQSAIQIPLLSRFLMKIYLSMDDVDEGKSGSGGGVSGMRKKGYDSIP